VKSRLLADVIEEVPNEVAPACTNNSPPAVDVLLDPTSADIKPSEILQDPSKVALLLEAFDPKGLLARIDYLTRPLEKTLVGKVDLLYRKLQVHFRGHVMRRFRASQQTNYCLDWICRNLAVVAVWMVVVGHAKRNISCLEESGCLLFNQTKFLLCSNNCS